MNHITVILGIDTATVSPEPSPEAYESIVEKSVSKTFARHFPNIKFNFEFIMDDNVETDIQFGDIKLTDAEKQFVTETIQEAELDAISDPAAYGM